MSIERIRELQQIQGKRGMLDFIQAKELDDLLRARAELPSNVNKKREGDRIFMFKYHRGNIYQNPDEMEKVTTEIWASTPQEAAEIACNQMLSQEKGSLTFIIDADSARLDVSKCNQLKKHKPIWVNPYSIAPSQQVDGGPLAFAENVLRTVTNEDVNIENGRVYFKS